jgi:tetratricopeptide (TPR) repeat protein
MAYYEKAVDATADSSVHFKYYAKLASLAKTQQDYIDQAKWLGKYYGSKPDASNVDLFNWGVAAYRAQDYLQSDSAFAIYTGKYPEQAYGYYWRALNNASIDTSMAEGRAIPHYQKLIEVIGDDSLTANHKKWKVDAYTYLAAYETNMEKDYQEAINYFSKILEMDPANEDAKKYIAILEKNLASKQEDTN